MDSGWTAAPGRRVGGPSASRRRTGKGPEAGRRRAGGGPEAGRRRAGAGSVTLADAVQEVGGGALDPGVHVAGTVQRR
nr:hypothetical protein StreXyl84_33710 [Streptomyces sp. Xyl84]